MTLPISPIGLWLLTAIGTSAAFVHFRGRVRHRFSRQLFDHSTLLAPFNIPLYLFSKVPGQPFQIRAPSPSSPCCTTIGGRSAMRA
jgi:aspartyl/asparaginyl beta-hydroxylase (cupin superfamily)